MDAAEPADIDMLDPENSGHLVPDTTIVCTIMRELEVGERVEIEDFRGVVAWQGQVIRAGGNVIVITDEQAPPAELKPNAPVRVNFSEERWLTKARGRVLERVERGVKILLVGQDERVQRRSHVRVPLSQATQISVAIGKRRTEDGRRRGRRHLRGRLPLCAARPPLAAADTVELECNLDGATIRLAGQVVSAWPDAGRYTAGIRATSMSPGRAGTDFPLRDRAQPPRPLQQPHAN